MTRDFDTQHQEFDAVMQFDLESFPPYDSVSDDEEIDLSFRWVNSYWKVTMNAS